MSKARIASVVALILVVLAAVWAVVYFTPLMSVKHIVAEGNEHVTDEEVVAASGVQPGTPLAQVDARAAASGVASLPWVKSATASRSWPSTIKLKVDENVAVAFINGSEGAVLIDAEGKDFATDTPPEGTIELTGGIDDEAVRKDAVDIASSLSEHGRNAVESIEARGAYDFVLHVKEGRTVVWGASEDNENKALALDTVLQREGVEFNVTNPQLVTVR